MSKVSDLTELKRKTFLATIQDGLDELLGGIFILIVAGMYLDLLFYIVLLLVIGLRNRILEGMRKKYTYKRIGRVQLRQGTFDQWQKALLILIAASVGALAACFILFSYVRPELIPWMRWFPTIFGLVFIGPSCYIAFKTGCPRYYLFGIGATVIGVLFSLVEFTPILHGWFLYLLSIGGIMVIVGCINFIRFLRKYPIVGFEGVGQ